MADVQLDPVRWPGADDAQPVMGVFRGFSPTETVRLASAAWEMGIHQVEVPIETSDAMPSLRAAIAAARERGRTVGAGTILTEEQMNAAIEAGATYLVSPGLDPQLIRKSLVRGIPFLPGIATPSEIIHAIDLGLTWVKAFPASVLGTAWFKAVRGPFPTIGIVATGGMDGRNASDFLTAGATVIGVSKALIDPAQADALASIIRSHAHDR